MKICVSVSESQLYVFSVTTWAAFTRGHIHFIYILIGLNLNFEPQLYVVNSANGMGSVYKKAVFRGYTDDTFTTLADRSDTDGILGVLML